MSASEGWMARIARRFGNAADALGAGVPESGPATDATASDAAVPPGIRINSRGHYVVGSFSFASLDQAVDYAERRAQPEAGAKSPPSTPPPARPSAAGPVPGHPEIRIDAAGRFRVGGFSFFSLDQALEHQAERTPALAPPAPRQPESMSAAPPAAACRHSTIRIDDKGRFRVGGFAFPTLEQAVGHAASLAETSPAPAAAPQEPPWPVPQQPGPVPGHPDVRLDEYGRYVVRGFSFSGLEQALDYASRLLKPATLGPLSNARLPLPTPPAVPIVPPAVRSFRPSTAALSTPRLEPLAPAVSPPSGASIWISEPRDLVAGGSFAFRADLIYYGSPNRYDPRHDCSRIDPRLSVDQRGDRAGTTLDYWPTYTHLDPRARATYLEWLTGGRSDPDIPIGYVFLFFYGLEQRLLIDDARDEAPAILAEVRRLLSIHGPNHSFASYAAKLLQLGAVYDDGDEEEEGPTAAWARNYELEVPFDVRVRLGRRIRDGAALSADDCLRWVLALPDVYLRTPGQRCFDELRQLWNARFAARYPTGLSIRRPRARLTHHYRAASGTFVADVSVGDLPDIGGTTSPLVPLRAMLDACIEELDAYSRLLGREPEARGRTRADLLLPPELRDGRPSLTDCRQRLGALFDQGQAVAPAAVIAGILDIELEHGADRLPAAVLRQMAAALDALHHGFEPDRRYGSSASLRRDTTLLLFSAADGGAVEHERASYLTARTMVEVSMLASASDGQVVAAEIESVERRLRALPDLGEPEIARLMAWGRALAADPPKVRAALKKLGQVPTASRAALAACALDAVLADGRVTAEEVRFLEALHASLGLPANSVYQALHRGAPDADLGPVTVLPGTPEEIVPLPPEITPGGGIAIDAARLERIRSETAKVSSILGAIFAEDEPPAPPRRKAAAAPAPAAFAGLDAAHGQLLALLVAAPMDRARFEAAARDLRLFPGGALDAINEWGFDRFDAPVIEDEDPLFVPPDIIDQLQAIGAAA